MYDATQPNGVQDTNDSLRRYIRSPAVRHKHWFVPFPGLPLILVALGRVLVSAEALLHELRGYSADIDALDSGHLHVYKLLGYVTRGSCGMFDRYRSRVFLPISEVWLRERSYKYSRRVVCLSAIIASRSQHHK